MQGLAKFSLLKARQQILLALHATKALLQILTSVVVLQKQPLTNKWIWLCFIKTLKKLGSGLN